MSKRKVYNYTRRTLAFLMAMIMTLSVVQSSTITAFAQTGSDVVMTETESSDVIEEMDTTVPDTEEDVAEPSVEESSDETVTESASSEAASEEVEEGSEAAEESLENVEESTEVIETTEAEIVATTVEATVEVVETVPVVDVMEDGDTYTGSEFTEDGRTGLEIVQSDMTIPAGSDFETEALAILTDSTNTSTYQIISISYDGITDAVNADLWNAALAKLNSENDQTVSIRVVYMGDDNTAGENWYFDTPSTVETDVKLGVDITVSEEENGGAEFSLSEDTSVSSDLAQEIGLTFNHSAVYTDVFNAYTNAFREGSYNIIDADENNVENVSAKFSYDYEFFLNISGMQNLSANTNYSFGGYVYTGIEFDAANGKGLEIVYSDMEIAEGADFEAEAIAVLNRTTNKYSQISLNYGEMTNSVDADLWNAALSKLEGEDGNEVTLTVNYCGSESVAGNFWCFKNPKAVSEDVKLDVSLVLPTENSSVSLILDEGVSVLEDLAQDVRMDLNLYSDKYPTLYNTYSDAFGTEDKKYIFTDSDEKLVEDAYVTYDYESDLIEICIYGMQNLSVNSTYLLSEYVYRGQYNEWEEEDGYTFRSLYIQPADVDNDKTSFTAAEIAEILSNYEEKTLDEITVVYRTDTIGGTVETAIINATLPYLKKSSEDRKSCIRIAFQTTKEEFTWILVNPGTQTADQTLTASFAVADGAATISVGSQSFVAEGVNINVSRSNEQNADGVAELKTLFGESVTRLSVGDTNAPAGFGIDEWSAWIWIDDVSQLTANTTYTLGKFVYKGSIGTWDDGTKELSIHYGEAGKDTAFSEQELLDILANYSTSDKLGSIYIEQPSGETDTIYKSVADKAADLFTNTGIVKFAFRDQTTGTAKEWMLEGISADVDQYSDQVVKAALTVSSNNLLVFNRDNFNLNVGDEGSVSIGYSINTSEDSALTEDVLGALGDEEGYRQITTYEPGVEGDMNYNSEENHLWLYLHHIDWLRDGKDYPIVNWFYRGEMEEMFDAEGNWTGTSLNISSHAIGKDTFDTATFNKIVEYWLKAGYSFERISIEQSFTSNNVVKKDIFNKARTLLSDPVNQEMTFTFCRCQMAEQDESGVEIKPFIQNDMNWHFQGITGKASKDIKANVTTAKKGGGVSVVLPSNTYPAKDTHVQFWMSEDADMVQNVLVPAFGKAQSQSSLVVLEKAATLKTLSNGDMPASYDGGDGMVNLFFANVEEWKAGIDNRLVEAYERTEAPIGEQASVVLFSYDPADPEDPGYPPEDENAEWNHPDQPKADIKFTLLTPDIATMGYRVNEKGTRYDYVIPNVPWKTVYTLCTYTSVSDETCVEVLAYPTTVEISGLSFEKEEVEFEWSKQDKEQGYYPEGFLSVNVTPKEAQNHINPQEFTWTVSQSEENPVIELQKYPYYSWDEEVQMDVYREERPDGAFKVVGYGEATVTVTYRDFAPITCTVKVLEPVQVPEIPSIFAIPAIDTTLYDLGTTTASEDGSAVHLDLDTLLKERGASYEGSFEWKDDLTKLASYANMEWAEFPAIYTALDGRQVSTTVPVEMLRITEIGLYAAEIYGSTDPETSQTVKTLYLEDLNGSSVVAGDELVIGYQVGINRAQFDEEGMTDEFATFFRYIAEGKLSINWKEQDSLTLIKYDAENPNDMTIDENVYNNGQIQKPSKYISTTKGKKTFTVEAVNKLTEKVIFKSSATVTVTGKPVFTFDGVEIEGLDDTAMKGNFLIKVDADAYTDAKKLTVKSADTSTLKLGRITVKTTETESGKVEITVPYEFKKFGKTVLKVTAADEVKTSESFTVERVDYAPKIPNTSYTIDKSWMYGSDETAVCRTTDSINIASRSDITLKGFVTIKEEAYHNIFKLVSMGDGWYILQVEKADLADLKNKTYTLTLEIPYKINADETGEVKYSEQKIKVKVTQSKIKVNAKQTKKINEFYTLTSVESNGIITLKTPYALMDCTLNDDSVFDLVLQNTNGYNEFTFALVLKDAYQNIEKLTDAQKKITLNYTLFNGSAEHNGLVNLTLKTENKKPSLILPKKSDTLYPGMDVCGSVFVVMNKSTGEPMDLTGNISLVLDKRKNITQAIVSGDDPAAYDSIKVGKNNYCINANGEELSYWLDDSANAVKATDKFIIRVQKENWNGYVDLTYSAKVDLKTPKLKLDSKTLTINANDAVYSYQTAGTHINLTGYAGTIFDEIWISGVKDADKNALKNNLSFAWNRDESKIQISIDDKGVLNEETGIDTRLKPGSYKFKVWTMLNGKKLSTDLTLKVVDKAPAKSVKVTKKGSIDVLRRSTTQITMNPKFTNLSGEIVDFRLTGPDAELFNYYYDWETGNCVVQAKEGTNYSTKITYNVTPVYRLADNGDYTVEGKAQKIKVTQGKPKVSVWTSKNILYGDKNNEVYFDFDAMLKNENIYVSDVKLLNYTNDLDWEWDWESDMGILSLNSNTPKDITKASGKYTLKFAVTYTDAAGNEKAAQVSYKLNIVR